MDSQEIDEDEIDSEALQAQIDLSMSFAQNLISSWVEPSKFPTSSRRKNLEQELAEYMKRPPRLGVGAAIPEGVQSMTRETSRLKGKLGGSKRSREDEVIASKPTSEDEDEGESRAGTFKRKVRPDPFDVIHGKKKKKKDKDKDSEKVIVSPVILPTTDPSRLDSSDEIEDLLKGPDQLSESPIKRQKKRENAVHDDNGEQEPSDTTDVSLSQQGATPPSSPKRRIGSAETPLTALRASKVEILQEVIDVSLAKTPVLPKILPHEMLKVPLLNLTGPPSDHDSDGEPATGTPSSSPKKKRKRRKKKKNHALTPDSTEANNSTRQTT